MGSGDSGGNYKEELLTVALHAGVSRRHSKLARGGCSFQCSLDRSWAASQNLGHTATAS